MPARILTTIGSVIAAGFGIWHFFVPKIWNWYSYINPKATELALAVRAINIFFSLSLTLIGVMNILLVWNGRTSKFTLLTVLAVSVVLWIVRSVLQIIYPQGSMQPALQYGMLAIFIIVALLFAVSFLLAWTDKSIG